jgi:CBS domain-containing protein
MHTVADLMTREIVALDPTDDLALAEAFLAAGHIRHLPVLSDGALVGLVTSHDVLRARALGLRCSDPVNAFMIKVLATVGPEATVPFAARSMLSLGIACLPVVSEEGALVGLVTEGDLARFAGELDGAATPAPPSAG